MSTNCKIDIRKSSRPILTLAFNFGDTEAVRERAYKKLTPLQVGTIPINRPQSYLPYTSNQRDTWDAVKEFDGDVNLVKLCYSKCKIPAGQSGDEYRSGWTREHIWPQSRMGTHGHMRPGIATDLHNLCPADSSMNSSRGNRFFGLGEQVVFDRSPACDQIARMGGKTECRFGNETWEPPDTTKGMIARVLMYMACVYADRGLKLVERDRKTENGKWPLEMGVLSVLLEWNDTYPPTDAERDRDKHIHSVQSNRNPFVSDPTLAYRVEW